MSDKSERRVSAFLWVLLKYRSVEMTRLFPMKQSNHIDHCFIKFNASHPSGCLSVLTSPNQSDLKGRKLRYEAGELVYITYATPWEIEHIFPDLIVYTTS